MKRGGVKIPLLGKEGLGEVGCIFKNND